MTRKSVNRGHDLAVGYHARQVYALRTIAGKQPDIYMLSLLVQNRSTTPPAFPNRAKPLCQG